MLALAVGIVGAPSAFADQPVFPVMNTSEYPPDGVYWRSGPDWNAAIRTTGHGFYAGDHVRLKCWEYGADNVPRRDGGHNNVWYQADNVTRPTSALGANSGWMNAHFVNDGTGPGQYYPIVTRCGNSAPPPPAQTPATPISLFMSPFNAGDKGKNSCGSNCGLSLDLIDTSVKTLYANEWRRDPNVACTLKSGIPETVATKFPNSKIVTLSGWSCGRLPVERFLNEASFSQLQDLEYVYLIDPGNSFELTSDASIGANAAFKRWFNANPAGHLVVLVGTRTAQQSNASLFQNWGRDVVLAPQAKECTYATDHYQSYYAGQYWIAHRILGGCPWLNWKGVVYKPQWNPSLVH